MSSLSTLLLSTLRSFGRILDGLNLSDGLSGVVSQFCLIFLVIGGISAVAGFTFVMCWSVSGERQALRIKEAYVEAILRQVCVMLSLLVGAGLSRVTARRHLSSCNRTSRGLPAASTS